MPTFVLGQSRRSKSDKNIELIGNRNVAQEPNNYSLKQEKQMGEQLAENVAKSSKFVTDSEIMRYLGRVDQNLEQNSDKHIPMTLHLIDSDTISASIAMGGQLFVTRGFLLHMDSEGELASLLARAIATTALRSQTRLATLVELTMISDAPASSAYRSGLPANGMITTDAPEVVTPKRDTEFDADYFGIQYLYKAGYDPNCFLQYVQQVGETSKTSPPIPKRLQALQKEIAEILPKRSQNIVTTPDFQQFKNRLQAMTQQGFAPKGPESQF